MTGRSSLSFNGAENCARISSPRWMRALRLIVELQRRKELRPYILATLDEHTLHVNAAMRGHIKHALVTIGYPGGGSGRLCGR